jgi:acid stress-induced BolA-like protein IbaG/YrbA
MATLTKSKLQSILTARLKLKDPQFVLEKNGARIFGSVISSSFKGKGDLQRVRLIRDAVDAELGPDSNRLVGTLLAYTPEEWNVDLEGHWMPRRAKAG